MLAVPMFAGCISVGTDYRAPGAFCGRVGAQRPTPVPCRATAVIWNALLLVLREIRRNLLRSFLTVPGIVIGVASVITMVTLGKRRHAGDRRPGRKSWQQSADGAAGTAHGAARFA